MADDTVMEEREDLMVSPSGGEAHLRRAHFLKPSITSVNGPVAAPCSAGGKGSPRPLKINYVGWGYHPLKKWKEWVGAMRSSHHSTWKRAGILNAIMSSTCFIHRREDLILWLVERWNPATNSFVFPWGEATITLEDMMVLGGYSVLGGSVLVPRDGEVEEKVNELLGSRLDIYNSGGQGRWINRFMGNGEMEKEAFLALWLSKFVFPFSCKSAATSSAVVAIAVYLARGIRIALAPAVLASIYRGLTSLKAAVADGNCVGKKKVEVSAPLAFVQVWALERFPALRLGPKWVGENEPRIARWGGFNHGWRARRPDEDYVGEDFKWRPYTSDVYRDDERWEIVESRLDEELESYVRCVRVSKVVGVEEGCVELYLPNRVAMQFGMDQDIPGHVGGDDVSFCFERAIRDAKLYVPPRLSQPRVTARYLGWWRKLNRGEEVAMAAAVSQLRDQTDVDFMPKQANMQVAKHHPWHSYLGRGSFKRTKRRYLEQFRRQRHSVDSASNTSSKSSKGHNGSVSPGSAPKRQQDKVSENENVQHVMSSVEETQVTEQVPEAVMVRPDETIGLSPSRERISAALQKLEDRARNLGKIFSLIEAGRLVCLSKGSL